jgi:hypothetical protein
LTPCPDGSVPTRTTDAVSTRTTDAVSTRTTDAVPTRTTDAVTAGPTRITDLYYRRPRQWRVVT